LRNFNHQTRIKFTWKLKPIKCSFKVSKVVHLITFKSRPNSNHSPKPRPQFNQETIF
jgi:hypothetical protein